MLRCCRVIRSGPSISPIVTEFRMTNATFFFYEGQYNYTEAR